MAATARSLLRAPLFALALLIVGYFAVSFALSYLRWEELATTNWDLGIFEQALWSTTHGHPFYEAGDWETYGVSSLLQVHPALFLYALVPLYAALPSAPTLFFVQSSAVALAAVPIYATGLKVIGRPAPALLVAGLYLIAAPLLLANLYDFHLESLLPLELTLLYYLWLTGRYRLGLLVAVAACLTLEVAPFLVAAVALVFLVPPVGPTLARLRSRSLGIPVLRRYLSGRTVRWAAGLLVLSVVTYLMLRLFEWQLLPDLLGVPATMPGPSGSGGVRSNILSLGFDFSFGLSEKLGFWLLLLGLFAFLPALAPRALILSLPWFLFTLQAGVVSWTTLGFQYAFVPMAGIALAAVYGFHAMEERLLPRLARRPRPGSPTARLKLTVPGLAGRRRLRPELWIVVGAVLLSTNFLIGPLNPLEQSLSSPVPGYRLSYEVPAGFDHARAVSALVPPGATVLATTDLFPLVANDLKAYSLMWTPQPPPQLPFTPGHLPAYVLLSSRYLFSAPGWLAEALENSSEFGLRAEAWATPSGPVFLWEAGYSGPIRTFAVPPTGEILIQGGSLDPIGIGGLAPAPGAPTTPVVRTDNDTGGVFFNSTPIDLAPGRYELSVLLRMNGSGAPPPVEAGAAQLIVSGFGEVPSLNRVVPAGALPNGSWVNSTFAFGSSEPILELRVSGALLLRHFDLEIAEVIVEPVPDGDG